MRIAALAVTALSLATPSLAATLSITRSFSGTALMYDPAKDYSPSTVLGGYHPPTQLGGYNGLLTFPGFDTSLGTLNQVSLTDSAVSTLEFKDAIAIYGTPGVVNTALYVTGGGPYGGSGFSMPYSFDIPVTRNSAGALIGADTGVKMNAAGPSTYSNNLAITFGLFYVPTIYVPILAYGVFQASTASYLTDITATFTYTYTIAYDYTPAAIIPPPPSGLPAPAPLGLLGVGVGLLAWLRRHGRPPATTSVCPVT